MPWSTIVIELISAWVVGLGVGLSSTFLGLGGGIIIVPLLPLIATVSVRAAIGTSLLTVFLVSIQNTWLFHQQKRVHWRLAFTIGCVSAIGAFVAGRLTGYASEFTLHLIFGSVLLMVSALTVWKAGGRKSESEETINLNAQANQHSEGALATTAPNSSALSNLTLTGKALGVGFSSGLVSGFTGIGGGVFVVPLLSMLGGVAQKYIVPTSVAAIAMTALAGTSAFFLEGLISRSSIFDSETRIDLAIAMFLGAVLSSRVAMKHQNTLSARNRDWLIGLLLLALSLRTLILILKQI